MKNKVKSCDCKEQCEDCEEEKVDLDNISNLLFNEIDNDSIQKEEGTKQIEQSEIKKVQKAKEPKKIEFQNTDYKDPISDEYRRMWNNKMGFTVWNKENRIFI